MFSRRAFLKGTSALALLGTGGCLSFSSQEHRTWKTDLGKRNTQNPQKIAVGGEKLYVIGSEGNATVLYSINRTKGTVDWQQPVPRSYSITADNSAVYTVVDPLSSNEAEIRSYSKAGDPRWTKTVPNTAPAVVGDDHVFIGGEAGIGAFRKSDGQTAWRYGSSVVAIAADSTRVYAGGEFGVAAWERQSGEEDWTTENENNTTVYSKPSRLAFNHLILSTDEGLKSYQTDTGELHCTFRGKITLSTLPLPRNKDMCGFSEEIH